MSGPNAAELEAELGCESTRWACEDLVHMHLCVSVYPPIDLITALKEDPGRRNPHKGWQPCVHTVFVFLLLSPSS